jgi:hypothetical protein
MRFPFGYRAISNCDLHIRYNRDGWWIDESSRQWYKQIGLIKRRRFWRISERRRLIEIRYLEPFNLSADSEPALRMRRSHP